MDSQERHIVLVHPEIHGNAGAIGRTCVGTNSFLHLIKPLGFSLSERYVKRAGLDYWPKVKLSVWDSMPQFMEQCGPQADEMALFSRFAARSFWEIRPRQRNFLFFGSETKGLPEKFKQGFPDRLFKIPTSEDIRSLNLATSVGIAVYHYLKPASM